MRDLNSGQPVAATARAPHLRSLAADGCYLLLSTSVWLGSTLLAALGIVLALPIVAAGGDLGVLFAHLHNLAAHYLAADPARRAAFETQAVALVGTCLLLLLLARAPSFAVRLRRELSKEGTR